MDISSYLKMMAEKNASDLFFSAGAPINIKIEGTTSALTRTPLEPSIVKKLVYTLMDSQQIREYESTLEMNLSLAVDGVGRFRVNIYRQRGEHAMVIRYIKSQIPSLGELNLKPILKQLIMEPRGLILVVGATGSGKTTSLASMIHYRNQRRTGHILTIEDPLEYMHSNIQSIVDQREVGIDTLSYANALRNAMRESPDVILIGEIRDRETMQHAMAYAETGHLCLSTLHASNASQTLDRILNFFPETAHRQLLTDLSMNLRAIISQRLILGINNKRLPVLEIMLNSPYISELIAKGEITKLTEAMEQTTGQGMQSFDQALYELYQDGKVDLEEALRNANSRNNLALRIHLASDGKVKMPEGLALDEDDIDDESVNS